jgi:hypothetical protein
VSRSSSSLQGEREFAFIIDFIILFTFIIQKPTDSRRKVGIGYGLNGIWGKEIMLLGKISKYCTILI